MTITSGGHAAQITRAGSKSQLTDFAVLMKPRVMSLVVFTAATGLMNAPRKFDPLTDFAVLLCIAAGAGAAGALNMWYDADIDAVMRRTATRPIPNGRLSGMLSSTQFGLSAERRKISSLAVQPVHCPQW